MSWTDGFSKTFFENFKQYKKFENLLPQKLSASYIVVDNF